WHNLPPGKQTLDIDDYKGRVLYLYCFQSWCPGCHRHGFPTLQKMLANFEDDDGVAFVAIQTVFEGFSSNTFARAREVGQQYNLAIPIGQSGEDNRRSEMMRYYRTGGAPWTIIIDQDGIVRYNDFHIDAPYATQLISGMLEESQEKSPLSKSKGAPEESTTLPESRAGGDVVGKRLKLEGLRWLNTKDNEPVDLQGIVTLVRWWTDTCPYCASSLPAIDGFSKLFPADQFQSIGVYHPKPPRPIQSSKILADARERGYYGPVALDQNWEVLEENYLSKKRRTATSVSFLLDKQGVIRFVHPGPEIHPSADPELLSVNSDYEDMTLAIKALLVE
ncbi:MAG: redoxin family protein, partial [Candidatus Zixiibacteriota bacterium]